MSIIKAGKAYKEKKESQRIKKNRYRGVIISETKKDSKGYFSEYLLLKSGVFEKHRVEGNTYSESRLRLIREIDFFLDEAGIAYYSYR